MTGQLGNIPCKVLLVDDEENILRAITRLLQEEENNLEVISATSGAQGLEALRADPNVALILSDQRMPGMGGSEFLQRAREVAPDAVRMVLTGYADMSATIDAINKGGASRYVSKPWDDDMLRHTILEGVEQYRLLQENRRLTALVQRQNDELSEWNGSLKNRVLEQTATIRCQNEELKSRNQQIGEAFRRTLVAFSRLIALHSSRLQEHTGNVTEISVAVAKDLGLPPDQVETVRTAALLHDIGVIGIAPEILVKRTTALTREELNLFLQHAVRGQTALDEVKELREAGVLIRHHHERYDGEGFPDRLCGSNIPLGARIIAYADFVDRSLEEERGEAAIAAVLDLATKELGHELDPALFSAMEPHVRALYTPARVQHGEVVEKELRPKQLLAGMLVTRDLYSGAGLPLLSKGTYLDAHKIALVVRHYVVDPPAGGIHVRWKPAEHRTNGSDATSAQDSETKVQPRQPGKVSKNQPAELAPGQLTEGMRITQNLYSGTGLLLLTKGTVLDAGKIASVTRYFEIDPPCCGVFVIQKE